VIPIYSSVSGRSLDTVRDRWSPLHGGVIVKNVGGVPLDIGDGGAAEFTQQAYCARPVSSGSPDLVLRPAGGAILPFPAGTRLDPGDSIVLVMFEESRNAILEGFVPEPLNDQRSRLLGIGDPEDIATYPLLVIEIKSQLETDGKPLFSRKAYIHLPPVVWVKKGA
jgi:hypothetical protein